MGHVVESVDDPGDFHFRRENDRRGGHDVSRFDVGRQGRWRRRQQRHAVEVDLHLVDPLKQNLDV